MLLRGKRIERLPLAESAHENDGDDDDGDDSPLQKETCAYLYACMYVCGNSCEDLNTVMTVPNFPVKLWMGRIGLFLQSVRV